MRISIFTVGTQGDARPFVALGRHLQTIGHEVCVITSDRHRSLVRRAGVAHRPIESDFAELMAREHASMESGNQLKVGRQMARALCEWMPRWVEQGMEATSGTELILGSGSGTVLGGSIAEKRGVPFVQAQFMPMTPSRHIPPLWPPPRRRLPGPVNLALAHAIRLTMWRMLSPPSAVLREALQLEPFPWRGPWYSARERAMQRPILYAFSRHLQPQPPDWPAARADVVGFWFLDEAQDWTPPPALEAFLAAGPPPIYVGFGSMLSGRPQDFTRLVLEAIRRSGRRAIVASGWGALAPSEADGRDDLFFIDNVPHDWLFPRVSLAVHHGGAGTTAAATRAGLPQVVVPFVADQFFWSWRLKTLGLNPILLDRAKMTPDDLAAAIQRSGCDNAVATAQRLGALIRSEDGAGNAVAALQRWGVLAHERPPERTAIIETALAGMPGAAR